MTDFLAGKIESLKNEIKHTSGLIDDRMERIGKGQTDMDDCFVSQRFNELNISLTRTKIEILKNGGLWEFDVLRDLETDEIVAEDIGNGQWGSFWWIKEEFRHKFGKTYGMAKRESTFTKKGLKRSTAMFPAWATTQANGSGMAGAYMSSVVIFKSSWNHAINKETV